MSLFPITILFLALATFALALSKNIVGNFLSRGASQSKSLAVTAFLALYFLSIISMPIGLIVLANGSCARALEPAAFENAQIWLAGGILLAAAGLFIDGARRRPPGLFAGGGRAASGRLYAEVARRR